MVTGGWAAWRSVVQKPFASPRAPLLMHFGASDPIIPPDDVNKTIDALPQAEMHIWPAGHGFNCDARADYNADVAKQAMERTLSFLGHHLRGRVG